MWWLLKINKFIVISLPNRKSENIVKTSKFVTITHITLAVNGKFNLPKICIFYCKDYCRKSKWQNSPKDLIGQILGVLTVQNEISGGK